MSVKVFEAREHCKQAEKHLKTSLLRWKPDYDSAADEYSQAAQCFRIARDLANSKDCHLKAADCYKKNHAFFHAAKALENAIIVCKDNASPDEVPYEGDSDDISGHGGFSGALSPGFLDAVTDLGAPPVGHSCSRSEGVVRGLLEQAQSIFDFVQIYSLAVESSSLYQQHGSGDSGASVLDKGAKILAENNPELAVKLYQQAADVSSTESSQHQGSEYISKASRILVKLQWYDQAVDSLRREIGFHQEAGNIGAIGRLTVAIVLVQLARGDAVAAEKAYKEWGSNCEVAEMQTLEQILQAYDEEDREAAKRALANPFIRNMDVEYARLASTVPLPEAMEPAPRATVVENAAPSYVSPNATCSTTAEVLHVEEESPYAPVTYAKKPEVKKSDDEDGLC